MSSVGYIFSTTPEIVDNYFKPIRIFQGPDCGKKLINSLIEDSRYIFHNFFNKTVEMSCTRENYLSFALQSNCGLCKRPFKLGDKLSRHHLHNNSSFQKLTHDKCNLLAKRYKKVYLSCNN